jgi:hypothetical protein
MKSGMSRGAFFLLIALLAIPLFLCLSAGLLAMTGRLNLTVAASEGMPQAQPGQVIVQQPVPTVAPVVIPTRDVAPPPDVVITPTPPPINPPPLTGNEGTGMPGVEPIPVDPNDPNAGVLGEQPQGELQQPASGVDESVQPFPAGSRPATGGGSTGGPAGGSAGYACGRRVVHVVQPGQNIFRIAMRYDTTINAIVWRNGIDDVRAVRPGTRLVVVTCEQR